MIKNNAYYKDESKHNREEVELQNDLNRIDKQCELKFYNEVYRNVKYSHIRHKQLDKQKEKAKTIIFNRIFNGLIDRLKEKLAVLGVEKC